MENKMLNLYVSYKVEEEGEKVIASTLPEQEEAIHKSTVLHSAVSRYRRIFYRLGPVLLTEIKQ